MWKKYSSGSCPSVMLVAVSSAVLDRMVTSVASRYFFVIPSSSSCPLPRSLVVALCFLIRKDAGAAVILPRIVYKYSLALSYTACVRARAIAAASPVPPVVGRVHTSINSKISERVRLTTVLVFSCQSSNSKRSVPLNLGRPLMKLRMLPLESAFVAA